MPSYYLWLTPDGEVAQWLRQLILQLSERYHGPRFDPHITLWGSIEGEESFLCEEAQEIARRIKPLWVHLLEPAYEDQYFRCLYYPVKKTPEIVEAHHQASHVFGKKPETSFSPHVSVLYGIYPLGVKQEILQSLPRDVPPSFLISKLELIRVDSTSPKDWHSVLTCVM